MWEPEADKTAVTGISLAVSLAAAGGRRKVSVSSTIRRVNDGGRKLIWVQLRCCQWRSSYRNNPVFEAWRQTGWRSWVHWNLWEAATDIIEKNRTVWFFFSFIFIPSVCDTFFFSHRSKSKTVRLFHKLSPISRDSLLLPCQRPHFFMTSFIYVFVYLCTTKRSCTAGIPALTSCRSVLKTFDSKHFSVSPGAEEVVCVLLMVRKLLLKPKREKK